MRLLSRPRGQPGAGRAPPSSSRPLARAVRPDARIDPPAGVRHAGLADALRRGRPRRCSRRGDAAVLEAQDALRVEYRRLLLRLASRDLTHHLGVDDAAAELADLAAGTLDAALAVARAKVGESAASCRLAVIAMGKCGGHELNYVSDVDVIFVAEPVGGVRRAAGHARRHPARLDDDAGLLGEHPRGHHLAGRRQPPPRGQVGSAGAHARQPPRLLRAVGEDLGVPGAAQGAAGGGRHGARPGVRRGDRPAGVVGRRARRLRRGGAGDAPPGARPHPGRTTPSASSSSAPADCATSSSPYSCCRWCTAAPTRRCGRRRR